MCTNPIRLYRKDDCGWYRKCPPTPLDRLDNPDLSFSLGFIIPLIIINVLVITLFTIWFLVENVLSV